MSLPETIKGILRTFVWLTREELNSMDHKVLRIGFGVISFVAAAIFWHMLFRTLSPF